MNTTNHYEQLENWLQKTSVIYATPIAQLRVILGEILQNVNKSAEIFNHANHKPQDYQTDIQKIVIDAVNYDKIKSILPKIEEKLLADHHNDSKPLLNIIHTLEHSSFTQEQISALENLLNNNSSESDFPEETDAEGLEQFTKSSIYHLKNESEKTLKAIREILQNAVDATDPRQHPSLVVKPGYKPQIDITTHFFDNNRKTMDLIIHDHGIGMNWKTVSEKFFVKFGSGKKDSKEATGGFGIAKVIIQNAPKDGWSIDTNSVHSSRFHKNIYLGTRKNVGYLPPKSKITDSGTTLSLFGVPYVDSYQIENLCKTYATNGRVAIVLNGNQVTPKFTLQDKDLVSVNSNIDSLPDIVGNTESEKEIAKTTFNKEFKNNLDDEVHTLTSILSTKGIKVGFFIKKHKNSYEGGNLYIMVNGQYQFHQNKYLNSIDIICSIETTIRPGSEDYPLDPGRDNIRGDLKDNIEKIVNTIRQFTDKVKENDLFKQGLEAIMVNTDADPLTAKMSEAQKSSLSTAITANLDDTMDHHSAEDRARSIVDSAVNLSHQSVNSVQEDFTIKRIADILQSGENKIEQKQKIQEVINGLMSPANIMIQKNFVARKTITNDNFHLNRDILILWQNSLKLLIDKLATSSLNRFKRVSQKQFIPGLIYSDECLGLYMPSKKEEGRPFPSVSINPITIAAATHSKYFQDNFSKNNEDDDDDSSVFSDQLQKSKNTEDLDTPTHNVAKLIFHIATHELTHLLFPDGYDSENFHKSITYVELYCHDAFEKIKKEVKDIMPELKKSSKQLLTVVAKEKKKNPQLQKVMESVSNNSFKNWIQKNIKRI